MVKNSMEFHPLETTTGIISELFDLDQNLVCREIGRLYRNQT